MKKQNEMIYERELDLWQYQMPYDSMTEKDVMRACEYGVLVHRNFLYDGDFLIGTWNNILNYMDEHLGYEMVGEYMKPLYVGKRVLD